MCEPTKPRRVYSISESWKFGFCTYRRVMYMDGASTIQLLANSIWTEAAHQQQDNHPPAPSQYRVVREYQAVTGRPHRVVRYGDGLDVQQSLLRGEWTDCPTPDHRLCQPVWKGRGVSGDGV